MKSLALVLVVALAILGGGAGCTHPPPDATPDGVVRAWLEHMEGSQDDPKEALAAFKLLGPAARANLAERAARASQMQGRRTEPIDLFAAGYFGLKFRPQSMKATVSGDHATVEVAGDRPEERATVTCVREGTAWRIEPELPPIAPLLTRGDGGAP